MTSIKSGIRAAVKPVLFRILGKRFYKYAQYYGKKRDIQLRLIDEDEMVLLEDFIKLGDTVMDLGANFAYYTERMSKIVGPNGKVYAFEPIPFTFEVFRMLVKKFRLNNVSYYQKGVSEKNETVRFRVPKMDYGTLSTGQAHISGRKNENDEGYKFTKEETFDCDVVSLDEFYNNSMPGLSFIKIDIEGAELFALRGAKNLINLYKPSILIEINPVFLEGFGLKESDLLEFIDSMGYETFHFNKDTGKLDIIKNKPLWEDNFILVHRSKIDSHKNIISDVQQ